MAEPYGNYISRLPDGRYEYGILIRNVRSVSSHYGFFGYYGEWIECPPTREPRGVAHTFEWANYLRDQLEA